MSIDVLSLGEYLPHLHFMNIGYMDMKYISIMNII